MPSYNTNLKTWGSTGQEYPDSYNYTEGEQPVDAWDNFLTSNLINDIEHLIDVTNDEFVTRDGTLAMNNDLPLGGNNIVGVQDINDDDGNAVYDYSNNHVPQERVEQGPGSGLDADTVDGFDSDGLGGEWKTVDEKNTTLTNVDSSGTSITLNADSSSYDHFKITYEAVDQTTNSVKVDTSFIVDGDGSSGSHFTNRIDWNNDIVEDLSTSEFLAIEGNKINSGELLVASGAEEVTLSHNGSAHNQDTTALGGEYKNGGSFTSIDMKVSSEGNDIDVKVLVEGKKF